MATDTYLRSQERIKSRSMIDNIGSYLPPTRRGRAINQFELRLQKRVAVTLHKKRVGIAKYLYNSDSTDVKEAVYPALVASGISPHSVEGYEDYILMLVNQQGGWSSYRSMLGDELEKAEYATGNIRKILVMFIWWVLMVMIAGGVASRLLPDTTVGAIIPSLLLTVVVVAFSFYQWPTLKKMIALRDEAAGGKKVNPDEFIPREHIS